MRIIFALPLLTLAACGVDNDPRNGQINISYDADQIENAAERAGDAAERVAADVGNAAEEAGREISNEVGDIDVDVNVDRDANGNSN